MFLNVDLCNMISSLKDKKIAVLYGGLSEEREVSLRSGKNVFNALQRFGLDIQLIDVDRNIVDNLKQKNIECVYNALHGTYGEDGIIQGILELLGISYTGENVLVSALCMNKFMTKEIWKSHNIYTPEYAMLEDYSHVTNEGVVTKNKSYFEFPFIVKPIVNGSSVNVFIVKSFKQFDELVKKLDVRHYFIEQYIRGKEITVGVVNINDEEKVLPILEINPKNEFYDYNAKYVEGMTEFIIPARLDEETANMVVMLAKKAYIVLGCRGVCRIDMIIEPSTNIPYLLENNTQGGMTDTSDIPKMLQHEEIDFGEFSLWLLAEAQKKRNSSIDILA